ncbi:MAG TPA: hypothetical protein PKO20_00310 [Clostridiales bacterium]|nr:hypothetical protein [Clostridiales bacterium]HQA04983.1 hypothetical protein [Clostridiales bacterium]HQD72325.1 hypothetical protein [Clostridiales bacterium]
MHRDTLERLKVFLIVLAVFFVFFVASYVSKTLDKSGKAEGMGIMSYAELNIGQDGNV